MRLNFDNTRLFSVGLDGVLSCFTILDRMPKVKESASLPLVTFSDQILIEKKRLDQLEKKITVSNENYVEELRVQKTRT